MLVYTAQFINDAYVACQRDLGTEPFFNNFQIVQGSVKRSCEIGESKLSIQKLK